MDNFELAYLLCRSNESTPILSPLHQLSLIPGPEPVSGVMSSVALEEVSEYQLVDVRNALLACPNVTQTTFPERPGLWFFEWRRPSRSIVVEVADFDTPEWPFWSGSALQTNCTFADLLDLWLALTRRVRAAWLHNSDCKMYSPESVVEELAMPALAMAFQSPHEGDRERANSERDRYLRLLRQFQDH